ncbi:MAG: hydroxymethylglutaryl-CoA synthase [Liquorilactobacillus ghanensis]|uniref:hydroxymethylglutaryl-CoA synthase n=1 Tax=Liquorilactobacillus ghanensis TaxID=399370 RepID=UPI0039E9A4D2
MKVGIDKIGFFTSDLYIDMVKLAKQRQEDPNKYLIGIGQKKMAVIRPTQDAVSLAANAAAQILTEKDRAKLGLVVFGTESGVDNSKSAAAYLAGLLQLPKNLRVVEIKQACYGATAGLDFAQGYIMLHPQEKVLVIGADIARYGLNTPGEPTQGGGAVAMLVTAAPRIIAFENVNTAAACDAGDFWRPLGETEARVAGKFSNNLYLDLLQQVWQEYIKQTGAKLEDFAGLLFHLPYTKLGLKGLRSLTTGADATTSVRLFKQFEAARMYNCQVGNLYTGSLYLSFLSLLKNSLELQAGQRIGFYSYGSGAQAEFFSGLLQPGFERQLAQINPAQQLAERHEISITAYEQLYRQQAVQAAELKLDFANDPAKYVFAGIHENQRSYTTH